MTVIRYNETMRARQIPDIYDGPNCDQHRPRWWGSADGDRDGDDEIGDDIELAAKTFPPGTKVIVMEPSCNKCGEVPTQIENEWKCGCDFNWKDWAEEEFS